jgi:glutamine---fructose-6-phosphate transaminase (isomerizing)
MPVEYIPDEIRETPEAIRATICAVRPEAAKAAAGMKERNPRRIFIFGNGTSLYSSMAATYTARALAGEDSPLVIAVPAGDFRHFPPALSSNDVVVGISASGEFRDVLAVFDTLKGKCLRVGVTHVPGSSITKNSDFLLTSQGGLSRVPVMTKTYASTLTAIHLLLMEFFSAPEEWYRDLAQTADLCDAAVKEAEVRVPKMVEELQHFEHAFYFGAGNAFPAALEGALKMKEMAILHAEGAETWEMASGPALIVTPQSFCTAIYTGSPKDADTESGARHAKEWGARVVEIGPRSVVNDLYLPVTAPKKDCFASLAMVPPAALLAYRMARARGFYPDRPEWSERYHSQGMSHIIEA